MFGNLGQLTNLLKNAGQIKQNMEAMQQRLGGERFAGEAGGGQVRATVDGRGELISVKFDAALVQAGDVEIIEDLTCAAVRSAVAQSREAMQKAMQAMTGGMNLPGMEGLLGG